MKQLNFLSKSSSRSCGHSSVTLASTVGSPSAHRRGTMLKHVAFLLLFLFAGVGNVWGDNYEIMDPSTESLTSGDEYLIAIHDRKAGKYYFVQSGSTKHLEQTVTAGVVSDPEVATVWIATASSSNWQFRKKGASSNGYLYNSGSNTTLNTNNGSATTWYVSNGSSGTPAYKYFKMQQGGSNSGRYICWNGSSFGAYANSNWSSNGVQGASANLGAGNGALQIFKKVVSCASEVAVSKGNETNGTYSLSGTSVCADLPGGTINISAITPADCYEFDEIIATNGTPDNTNKKVTGITAATTITVKFRKKTVNTYIDEIQGNATLEDCGTHSAPALDDEDAATSGTCAQQHYHFMGWVIEANKANPTDDNIIAAGTSMTANGSTYYAVWAKAGKEAGTGYELVTNASSLSTGDKLLVASAKTTSTCVLGYQDTNNRRSISGVTITNNSINPNIATSNSETTKAFELELQGSSGSWYLYDAANNKYLQANGGTSSNKLTGHTGSSHDNHDTWTIAINSTTSVATIQTLAGTANSNRGWMRWNNGSSLFACYNSGQQDIYLFKNSQSWEDYRAVCCTALGSINGSFFWSTLFEPLSPDKFRSHVLLCNHLFSSIHHRIPPHLIYTMYISRDFGFF